MEKEELNLSVDKLFNCLTEWSDVTTNINSIGKKEITCKIKDNYDYKYDIVMGNGLTIFSKDNLITSKKLSHLITNIGEGQILLSPSYRIVLITSFCSELDAAIDLIGEKKTKKIF